MTLIKNCTFIQGNKPIDSTEKFTNAGEIDVIENCTIYIRKGRAAINIFR